MAKITVSEKHNANPDAKLLDNNVQLTSWGAIHYNKSDFFPASFKIKTEGLTFYVDPIHVNAEDKADYIFITHEHADHFSIEDILKLAKAETQIICPKKVEDKLRQQQLKLIVVKPYEKLELKGLDVETVAAYNTQPSFLWMYAHPKSAGNVGYVFTLSNGYRIYHAGDTDYIADVIRVTNIDLALLPVGGDKKTIDVKEVVKIAKIMEPKVLVPMHFDLAKVGIVKELQAQLPLVKVELMVST